MLTYGITSQGDTLSIQSLGGFPEALRPPVVCPQCHAVLVPYLGNIDPHHFEHPSKSTCSIRFGENALHASAKMHLSYLLQLKADHSSDIRLTVPIHIPCKNTCGWYQTRDSLLRLHPSDKVLFEHRLEDRFVPDVCVLRQDVPIFAGEIVVSHTCSYAKKSFYADHGILAMEMQASTVLTSQWNSLWETPIWMAHTKVCSACSDATLSADTEIVRIRKEKAKLSFRDYPSNGSRREVQDFLRSTREQNETDLLLIHFRIAPFLWETSITLTRSEIVATNLDHALGMPLPSGDLNAWMLSLVGKRVRTTLQASRPVSFEKIKL